MSTAKQILHTHTGMTDARETSYCCSRQSRLARRIQIQIQIQIEAVINTTASRSLIGKLVSYSALEEAYVRARVEHGEGSGEV